jgi:cation diffusion facilitator family transporter
LSQATRSQKKRGFDKERTIAVIHLNNSQITSQNHSSHQIHEVQRVTLWGLAANLSLSAIKFIFGFLGNSQALVADAVHSLSDSTTDIAVLIGAPYWVAPADAEHPHGHSRIETIITFLIGVVLIAVGLGLIYHALATLQDPHKTLPGWNVFAIACVSMVSKELLYRWTVIIGKRVRSTALIANAWHHRSDGLSSLPVAIAVVGMRLRPNWIYLDHIAAMMVSLLILQASWKILWPALKQLTDAGASQEERDHLNALVTSIEGVRAAHALRTRQIGTGLQVDLHVLVDPELTVGEGHDIAYAVKERLLREGRDVIDVLIHIEPYKLEG